MKLPKGITGFNLNWTKEEQALSKNKISKVIGLIKAYRFHELIESIEPTHSSNYYRIKLKEHKTNELYDLLINPVELFSCCTESNSEWMNLKFITFPTILKQTLEQYIIILEPEFLNKKADPAELEQLDKFEMKVIKFCKTEKIGEIIFNGYD